MGIWIAIAPIATLVSGSCEKIVKRTRSLSDVALKTANSGTQCGSHASLITSPARAISPIHLSKKRHVDCPLCGRCARADIKLRGCGRRIEDALGLRCGRCRSLARSSALAVKPGLRRFFSILFDVRLLAGGKHRPCSQGLISTLSALSFVRYMPGVPRNLMCGDVSRIAGNIRAVNALLTLGEATPVVGTSTPDGRRSGRPEADGRIAINDALLARCKAPNVLAARTFCTVHANRADPLSGLFFGQQRTALRECPVCRT